ncbi:glutathione transferase GstA [Novispirillum itersonii]|uniref:Glutathione S-transferase n=1 Tax=Novispirillum itersonii TaxID=189 RepID=A0A7W9ZEB2_NOVIT|nr:glutathione transferase GstA [Novispirillum itersonii]MBB6209563.1 glutathione S-transferase [Novispirillum itersonii]
MKLYYSPGACSLASHIVLREVGAAVELEKVALATRTTESGADFAAINPKGYVPALVLDDGALLTEGVAIMQYAAETHPQAGLAPKTPLERARVQEALNYLGTEVHKSFSPLFKPWTTEEGKVQARDMVLKRLGLIESQLADGRAWLLGDAVSVADFYLFVITNWAAHVAVPLDGFPHLNALRGKIAARPAVQAALKAEGLA